MPVATNATWNSVTGTGDFNTGTNWVDGVAPNGLADTATFDTSDHVAISFSTNTTVASWTFNVGASDYSFTVGSISLLFAGAGIVINGGSASITNNNVLGFGGNSTAGGATITNNNNLSFTEDSTAGNATITNDGVFLTFGGHSSADSATITNNQLAIFDENSTAGNATITNNFSLGFHGNSTAGGATITNNNNLILNTDSTAGNATIANNGTLRFENRSTGGNAQLINALGGTVDFSATTGPSSDNKVTTGSIAGAGDYYLGGNQLTVGSNNLSTAVSGSIQDGGNAGGSGASLVKVGSGTLTLSGNNGYTGSTHVEAGVLALSGLGTATHSSSVVVDHGAKLSGDLSFSGPSANSFVNKGTFAGRAHLGDGNDTFNGKGGSKATVFGDGGSDKLTCGSGKDVLNGGADDDTLTGGRGHDVLTGGLGRDLFDFNSIKESVKGSQRDKILDFKHGTNITGDDIDLRTIDAKTSVAGNNAFKFIGKQGFHDVKGELRYIDKGSSCIVQGDVNGDGKPDFEIFVKIGSLHKGDFLL